MLQCTELHEYAISFIDKTTISELVHLMQHARYNVMIDSGLAHLAHLCTPPEIFVFGPDIPQKWFPQ
ncbi:MAG: glycosyltransferase family 9 protein [Patescibacteria group bacterium]